MRGLDPPAIPSLMLDLYELTMAQSYFERGMGEIATFSLFARHLPRDWGYFLAAGLDDVLSYLESFAFTTDELAYLASTRLFSLDFLGHLRDLRFTGSVCALPEGTVFFPDEPALEVTAPLIEAQIVETAILNQVHFSTIVASKAARCVEAAAGRRLVEFGARRAHGTDAALKAARGAYLAGFAATSNVLAGQRYGIPIAGTMAHSYIQAFPDELAAFRAYARAFPDACLLLVDTYDTVEGARRAALVGRELAAQGHRLRGVRLDSGDLIGLSFEVRRILDAVGLADATIFASGSVDEHLVARAVAEHAPIDAFGVGTRLAVSADAPYLDMAYKLVAYGGRPVLKLSTGKATWPGPKQVWRAEGPGGAVEDWIGLADEEGPEGGHPLLEPAMVNGARLRSEAIEVARARASREIASLPEATRRIIAPAASEVHFTQRVQQLRADIVARWRASAGPDGDEATV